MEEPVSWDELRAMTGRELAAGAVAGLAEHSVMFPFDTIKTRLQSQPEQAFARCLRDSIRNDGALSLYRGLGPALTAAVPAHAAYFGAYEAVKRSLIQKSSSTGEEVSRLGSMPLAHAVSGCLAVSIHDATTLPFDVVKQHMQVDHKHTSMLACFRHVLGREGGIRRVYSSLPITIAMNLPYVSTHWVVYEYLRAAFKLEQPSSPEGHLLPVLVPTDSGERNHKQQHQQRDEKVVTSSAVAQPLEAEENAFQFRYVAAGFIAGSCAAAVSNPCDVIKTNLQLDDSRKWSTTAATTARLLREHGWSVFTSGMLPRVMQIGPSAAIVMTSYEVAKKLFGG